MVLPARRQIGYGYRLYTPKAEVIGAGADFTLSSRAHDVARAILVGAQKRSATVNFLSLGGLSGIVGRVRPLRGNVFVQQIVAVIRGQTYFRIDFQNVWFVESPWNIAMARMDLPSIAGSGR